ncbi:hypothetical protein N510_003187 [Firmicutes bacterium ASF500]|nr:hypothetical protein N510_003187 [Firmicutes bacterium ASF500]
MKRFLTLMLAAALALSLTACGGGTGDANTPSTGNGNATSTDTPSGGGDNANTDASSGEEDSSTDTHKVGDTVETKYYSVTLKDITFTDKILVCHGEKADKDTFGNAEEFFTPSDEAFVDENGYVIDGIHGFSMRQDSDNTYLYYNLEFKFIGKEKRHSSLVITEFKPVVLYEDFTFDSDYMAFGRIIDKVKFNNCMWFNFNSDDYKLVRGLGLMIGGGLDDELKPLSNDVYEVRGIIQVPKVVAEDKEAELTIKLVGISYSFSQNT